MYDIGETVKRGVERARERGIKFVTVHGDEEIMRKAVEGRGESDFLKIFAITVLTSLDNAALRKMGYALTVEELVDLRVRKAIECGVDGIIASPLDHPDEIRKLAQHNGLLIATPGIRPAGRAVDDHKRAATPAEAIESGADYLIVGRPIIAQDDPAKAALAIIAEMRDADEKRRAAGL
jgi:orotidine-5'-phosphate decarboxylase